MLDDVGCGGVQTDPTCWVKVLHFGYDFTHKPLRGTMPTSFAAPYGGTQLFLKKRKLAATILALNILGFCIGLILLTVILNRSISPKSSVFVIFKHAIEVMS